MQKFWVEILIEVEADDEAAARTKAEELVLSGSAKFSIECVYCNELDL